MRIISYTHTSPLSLFRVTTCHSAYDYCTFSWIGWYKIYFWTIFGSALNLAHSSQTVHFKQRISSNWPLINSILVSQCGFISKLVTPLKLSRLGQFGQRGKSILVIEIETVICLCLSVSSLGIPWIKMVMGWSPSETSGLL